MDFLDKLGKAARTAADKTGDIIEIGKINSKINSEKANILENKQKIGEYYWIKFLSGDQMDNEVANICRDIKKSEDIIAGLEAQKEAIKSGEDDKDTVVSEGALKCPMCGEYVGMDCKFCPHCGAKM